MWEELRGDKRLKRAVHGFVIRIHSRYHPGGLHSGAGVIASELKLKSGKADRYISGEEPQT